VVECARSESEYLSKAGRGFLKCPLNGVRITLNASLKKALIEKDLEYYLYEWFYISSSTSTLRRARPFLST